VKAEKINHYNARTHRVMIHGVLHLLGYKDKSPKSKKEMTVKEDWALGMLQE
jgi:probable rRNA maturation factor